MSLEFRREVQNGDNVFLRCQHIVIFMMRLNEFTKGVPVDRGKDQGLSPGKLQN